MGTLYTDISNEALNYLINNTNDDLTFIQVLKATGTINGAFMQNMGLYNQYSYKKTISGIIIKNTNMFNYFNTQNINTPICLIYITGHNTDISNTDEFLPITNTITFNDLLNYVQRRLKLIPITTNTLLLNYLKYTIYELTFIQLSYSSGNTTVNKNIDISNTITNVLTNYNYTYEYLDISNQSIFNVYSDSNKPGLLLFFQNISDYTSNSNIINIDQTTTQLTITNFMKSALPIPNNTSTINDINLYIQYNNYDMTFIKVVTPSITNVNITIDMNTYINNKNIKYLDICNNTLYNNILSGYVGDNDPRYQLPILLLTIKDYLPKIKNYASPYIFNNYANVILLTNNPNNITYFDNFLQSRIQNTIYEINTLKLYYKYSKYDLNIIQITKPDIILNIDISNNILNNSYTNLYNYFDISNTDLYSIYNTNPSNNNPILLFFIKEYRLLENSISSSYINTIPDYTIYFTNLIQSYIQQFAINSVIMLNNYIKYTTYQFTYLQVRKSFSINTNIINIIDQYTQENNFEYIDISNVQIYNYYNTQVTTNILVLYTNLNKSVYHYVFITDKFSILNLNILLNSYISPINSYNDFITYNFLSNDLTFVQITKEGITKNYQILDTIVNLQLTNKSYNYIEIHNTEIFNKYGNNNLPILLINIKGLYNILSNINNNYNSYIILNNSLNTNTLYAYIQSKLNTTITTMEQLFIYLKYTTFDITFIRLVNLKPIISTIYIISLLKEYNINNKKYELIEITSKEILNRYKAYVRAIPSLLLFKNIYFTEDLFWQPCKFLSGENTIFANKPANINNSYLDKSLGQLQIFLKNGLK
jgi:hypothetical protein